MSTRFVVAAVVGIVVGVVTENPVLGFQAFSLTYGVTGFLDPNAKVLGPKLNDLKAPQASYGAPIPYIEGAPRLAGCVVWASNKRSVANETTQDGKGGPGVDTTTYTYELDMLVELAINRCSAVRRVWSNGKLVWSVADDASDATLRAAKTSNSWRALRFYSGAPDQLPDPVYEAAVGVGNAPAYRGRTTVMLEGVNLGNSGQLPVLTFEVLSESSETRSIGTFTSVPQARSYIGGIPAMSLNGFDLLTGVWNEGLSRIDYVAIYRVNSDGTNALVDQIPTGTGTPYTSAKGNSDVSMIAICGIGDAIYKVYTADGSVITYDCTLLGGVLSDYLRISRVGSNAVVGAANGGNKKLLRFSAAGGGLLATSLPMAKAVSSLVIIGADVYALASDGTDIYRLDLSTLTLQSTLTPPLVATSGHVISDGEGGLLFVLPNGTPDFGAAYLWNGSMWNKVSTGLSGGVPGGGAAGDSQTTCGFTYENGEHLAFNWLGSSGPAVVHQVLKRVAITSPTLDQVVRRLCLRTGQLGDADFDVAALSGDVVRAMALTQPGTARQAIETLMGGYLFESREAAKLNFVKRGAAPVATIPYADLGASAEGDAEPLPKKRVNDIEVPAVVTIRYANVLNDFQDGAESGDRLVTESTATNVVEIPLGFTPTEAKRIADANTLDLAVSLTQIGPVAVSRKYAALEPSDVVILTAVDGSTFRARVSKITFANGVYSLDLVLDDATALASSAATDSSYASSTLIRTLGDTRLEMLDIPILRDVDDGPGFYAAFTSTGRWPGAELSKSLDDVTYAKVLDVNDAAVMGVTQTALSAFSGGYVFDETSTVTVDVGLGTLSSSTRDTLIESGIVNALLVGSEIVQFRTASLLSPGVYLLSGLLRGRRGTEWAMGAHAVGERVVLLQAAGLRRVVDSTADIGVPYRWKATTFGKSRAVVPPIAFADTEVGLKPFSPVDIRALPSGVQDISVTWKRRTRLETAFAGPAGAVVPLGEASERYEVDVFVGATLKRTIAATAPIVTYSRGMQANDGVSTVTAITFKVFQLSEAVGRGYPGTASAQGLRNPLGQISAITLGGVFDAGRTVSAIFYGLVNTSTNAPLAPTGVSTTSATSLTATADAIRAQINASSVLASAGVSATAAGAVVLVAGAVGQAFTLAGSIGGQLEIPGTVVQSAAAAGPGTTRKVNVSLVPTDGSAAFLSQAGCRYTAEFYKGSSAYPTRQVIYSIVETPEAAGATATQLLYRLTASTPTVYRNASVVTEASGILWNPAYGYDSSPRAEFPINETDWFFRGFASDGRASFSTAVVDEGTLATAVDQPQIVSFFLGYASSNPTTGAVIRTRLAGVNYDYTVPPSSTWSSVIAGIKALIEASLLYSVVDASSGGTVGSTINYRVTSNTANSPFTFSAIFNPSTMTISVDTTQQAT